MRTNLFLCSLEQCTLKYVFTGFTPPKMFVAHANRCGLSMFLNWQFLNCRHYAVFRLCYSLVVYSSIHTTGLVELNMKPLQRSISYGGDNQYSYLMASTMKKISFVLSTQACQPSYGVGLQCTPCTYFWIDRFNFGN